MAGTSLARSRAELARRRARSLERRRARALAALAALVLGVAAVVAALGPLRPSLERALLPLEYAAIIREQARAKGLDPALVAAVIYEESKFRDRTSHAGARGLMQITPQTALFVAERSGGQSFVLSDLSRPDINIAYGCWYLRYLLDRYRGNVTLAVAAYNAGHSNVDRWVARAGGAAAFDPRSDIPFHETREYVADVARRREQYRRLYKHELGL